MEIGKPLRRERVEPIPYGVPEHKPAPTPIPEPAPTRAPEPERVPA